MGNASMRDQLGAVFNKDSETSTDDSPVPSKKKQQKPAKKAVKINLPKPFHWLGDGVDHINISPAGHSDLGQTLHPSSRLNFVHDVFGAFSSISAFWDYLETGGQDERMRFMLPGERLELKRSLPQVKVDHLAFLLLDASWQRIRTYERLKDVLTKSTLPFDFYQAHGDGRQPMRFDRQWWLVEGMNHIREALAGGNTPNFARWSQNKSRQEIFDAFIAAFSPKITTRESRKQNNLLKELRRSGPKTAASPRRARPSVKVAPVAQQPLETLSKVEMADEQKYQDFTALALNDANDPKPTLRQVEITDSPVASLPVAAEAAEVEPSIEPTEVTGDVDNVRDGALVDEVAQQTAA